MADEPRFSVGQPVTCVICDGIWIVSGFIKVQLPRLEPFYRYSLVSGIRHEEYVPEVWLDAARIKNPTMMLVRNTNQYGSAA